MDEPPSVAEWLKSSGCKRGHGNDFAKWGPLTKEESAYTQCRFEKLIDARDAVQLPPQQSQ